jgi:O-antigen ligase/Flp pilus assembly protein TadD
MSSLGSKPAHRQRQRIRQYLPAQSGWTARLTQLTDAGLLLTLTAVTLCFGGRTEIGQLVLVVLTAATTIVWCLRQLAADTPGWSATGTLWLLGLGAAIPIVQLIPLAPGWLEAVSPEHGRLLPLWNSSADAMFPAWTTLSLNPAQTISGLVTYLCYALVFLVAVQRIGDLSDVERLLKGMVCIGVAIAAFSILQYLFSNNLFFWFYQHPTVTTNLYAAGPFTNRNHLAQYLAMMLGPAIWWLVRATDTDPERTVAFGGKNRAHRPLMMAAIGLGLAAILLAGLMTLSRAGAAAMAVAVLVCLGLLGRRGHLPAAVLPATLVIGLLVGGGAIATNYESLAGRIDHLQSDLRPVIWAANIRLACRFPWLGTGVGTHPSAHQLETDISGNEREFSHAESGYLQIASECGLSGAAIMGLMIVTALGWCWRASRPAAAREVSIASAAIFSSFAANLTHAAVDFFWFAPACMLVIVLLAACVCRLSQFALADQSSHDAMTRRSRPMWGGAVIGMTALAAWMISIKLPGALAEPHQTAYLRILRSDAQDLSEVDPLDLEQEKMGLLIRAARLDPSNSRSQLSVAEGYLRLFQLKQALSDNPMTLDQLRDAALASEFESSKALNEWLQAAIGPHSKYLHAARHYARKSLMLCPLEGLGYLELARLDFLRDPEAKGSERLQQQALAVRPFDAEIDFEIGRLASQQGDLTRAMTFWRKAFQRSSKYLREIASGLAGQLTAAEFIENFAPDRESLGVVLRAYEAADLEGELPLLRERYAEACLADARRLPAAGAEFVRLEAVKTYRAAGQTSSAIQAASTALQTHTQSIELHKLLAGLLIEQQDYRRAAKHLKWAAARTPGDSALQRLAAETTQQALRDNNDGAGYR